MEVGLAQQHQHVRSSSAGTPLCHNAARNVKSRLMPYCLDAAPSARARQMTRPNLPLEDVSHEWIRAGPEPELAGLTRWFLSVHDAQ